MVYHHLPLTLDRVAAYNEEAPFGKRHCDGNPYG